jgi:hypothetical protein
MQPTSTIHAAVRAVLREGVPGNGNVISFVAA